MEIININVNRQIDGYTFSISPTIREQIRHWFPNSHPANYIFVSYDTKSDFGNYFGKLENFIYPALLGIENQSEIKKIIGEILFIDSKTGDMLHLHKLSA